MRKDIGLEGDEGILPGDERREGKEICPKTGHFVVRFQDNLYLHNIL
jgi:hypothetical protein